MGAVVLNDSGVSTDAVMASLRQNPEVASLITWSKSTQGPADPRNRAGGLFERDRYVTPQNVYHQFQMAQDAVESDDVVGSVADATEALAFRDVSIECEDEDEEDIWEQISEDIDLDSRMREIWREEFAVSNVCLPASSMVYTVAGPKPIDEVGPGTRVWGWRDGRLVEARVSACAPSGTKELWELRTRNHVLRCTGDHRVLVLTSDGNRETRRRVDYEWKEAQRVRRGDVVVGLRRAPAVLQVAEYPSVDIARLVGILVGDGTRNKNYVLPTTAADRFWSHVEKTDTCWNWTGRRHRSGCGDWAFSSGERGHKSQKSRLAHRIAWEFVHGPLPRHSRLYPVCGNPLCVRPDPDHRRFHLGTSATPIPPFDFSEAGRVQSAFSIAANDFEIDGWSDLIEEITGTPPGRSKCSTIHSLRFTCPELLQWVVGTMVHKSPQRIVPSWVWTAPPKIQMAFLSGYLEADGHLSTRQGIEQAQVACRSETLARELRILSQYLGLAPTNIRTYLTQKGGFGDARQGRRSMWSFSLYFDPQRRQVPSSWARRELAMDSSLNGRTVVSARPLGIEDQVWDLTVPGPDSFIADGLVVHNCAAVWWGTKTYKVRGKTPDGNKKRKTFDNLKVPVGITILDPLKVVPVGNFLFNQELLCYRADRTEQDVIDTYLLAKEGLGMGDDPAGSDPVIARLIQSKFEPGRRDRKQLGELGIDVSRLYVLDPSSVYRQTATRSQYMRFAAVRMKSIFELLDLKHQLRQMDRAHLVGATKFILLIKKGSEKQPALQGEIDHLNMSVRTLAQVPVLVGDHRLSVEIVTPKIDHTLDPARHLGVDVRISARLYGMFLTSQSRGDDSVKLSKVVSRGLEGRRDAQRRSIMRAIFLPCYERNDALTERPAMKFHPRRIALDFDPALASYLLDLRDRGDLSRASILSEIDYDEAEEARKRKIEAELYDDIFQTSVPYSAPGAGQPGQPGQITPPGQPGPTDPKAGGRRRGGNRGGGGAAPGSGQGQAPRRPSRVAAIAKQPNESAELRRAKDRVEELEAEVKRLAAASDLGAAEPKKEDK